MFRVAHEEMQKSRPKIILEYREKIKKLQERHPISGATSSVIANTLTALFE